MWVTQSWYCATEDSLRGANITAATFQAKIAEYYDAYRIEYVLASVESGLFQDRSSREAMYKERSAESIYNKWN